MRVTRRMTVTRLVAGAALAGGLLVSGASAAAAAATPADLEALLNYEDRYAARSTWVHVKNLSGCRLKVTDMGLEHGKWTPLVHPDLGDTDGGLPAGGTAVHSWRSQSNGFMTGTEGTVTLTTAGCCDSRLGRKTVKIHWDNPYWGRNSYSGDGTDKAFRVTFTPGRGNNAHVTATITQAPVRTPREASTTQAK
jgi:hypothetical protein